MKLRVYIDTSVFSARFDERALERMALTKSFFDRITEFEVVTSSLTREEIADTKDAKLRERLLGLLELVEVHEITSEMNALARRYQDAGAFTATMSDDALHVAAAVVLRQEVLVSWNFRHLVNRRRRARVSEMNRIWQLPAIEIMVPAEL